MSEEHSRWQGRRYGWQESLHSVGEFRYFLSGWPNVSRCSKANKVSKLNSFHYFYYLSKYEFIQREAASAVYAVVVCPSIRPSVQHKPVLYQILNVGSRKQIRAIARYYTQPPYLHNLISVQRLRRTRSSSVVTHARPPSSSSLKINDCLFRYPSPCLWNQLPLCLRQPNSGTSSSISDSPIPSTITSSPSDSPLCTSITPFVFHCRLKTYLSHKSYPS